MVPFFGDFDTTETVYIPFNTFSSDDPSASVTITNLVAGDIEIHKDGGTTQRSSDSGVTVSIDFDSVTGNHMVSIDLSDNTDAGFYSAGSQYQVRIEGTTVDGATINAWIGAFSIGRTLRPSTDGRTLAVDGDGYASANVVEISGDSTAADNLESAYDGTGYDVGGIDVSELNTAVDAIGSDGTGLTEAGGTGDQLTALPWPAAWDAEVQSEVNDALVALHLDHLLAADYDPSSKPGVATALLNELVENDAGVSRFTENALEQAPSGTGASAATIADAVWDEAQVDHVSAGSFGEIATEIASIETDTNELQTNQGNWLTATGFSTHSAADVVNEWETQSQADPTGFHVNVLEVNGTAQTANDNGADINAILTDTNELQTDDIPGTLTTIEGKIDTIDGIVDSILVDTGTTLQGELDGIQADTEDLQTQIGTAGDGLTAIADLIWDEAIEGTETARQKMNLHSAVLLNKSSGGGTTTSTFRNAADDKNRISATTDANGNRTAIGTRDGA